MNKIKDIWEKVTQTTFPRPGKFAYAADYNIEAFAKALIDECINVARNADNGDSVYAWYAIEEHFKENNV